MTEQLSENIPVANNPAEATLPQAQQPAESLDTYENIVGAPKAPPVQQDIQTQQPAAPQQVQEGQAPIQEAEPEDLMQRPVSQVTLAEVLEQFRASEQPQAQENVEVEEEEEVVMTEAEIAEEFKASIKAQLPYLEDDDVLAVATVNAKLVKPLADKNMKLEQDIEDIKKAIAPLMQRLEFEQLDQENKAIRAGMKQALPDFDQVEPYMQAFYDKNREALDQVFQFESLPKPAKAQLLYGIVKNMVPPGAPAAQQSGPPISQPQIRQQHSTLPPPTANLPGGQANARPVDRLMGDVLGLFEGKAPR